jgi:hypothetical protein
VTRSLPSSGESKIKKPLKGLAIAGAIPA